MDPFEAAIRELTRPLNGQYPRPWMTDLPDPRQATVFIVGKNQRNGYPVEQVASHERHLDALFNRNGQSCRGLYDEITGGRPSPTRLNMDHLAAGLRRRGVQGVLETNVVCYSTPMSADLATVQHVGGKQRGQEIFRTLLRFIKPKVLIAHGADTRRLLEGVVEAPLPDAPESDGPPSSEIVSSRAFHGLIIVVPSLAPPAYNKWAGWAPAHLDRVADEVGRNLRDGQ
jgi:hypothetical protein